MDALVRGGGRPEWVKAHLDTLLTENPEAPAYWAAYGVICSGLGLRDSADAAIRQARRLAPEAIVLAELERHLREPDGYRRALREDWARVVTL